MACSPERFTNDDSDHGVAALDRSRSQEYLAHQCCPRRQVPKATRPPGGDRQDLRRRR